ncbi:CoA transferase [Variovorax paradoxus]|nr:CoA transferase [Variovorax paradoxus]
MECAGPLSHLTVIEFAGLGPAPFAAMMLADMGARVIRIDRPVKPSGKKEGMSALTARNSDVLARGRESVFLDLKSAVGKQAALRLVERADVLIEGFRPGVMESLGLGPDVCLQRRPSLVYGRVTGWGQTGPLAQAAGHDINFIALTGALHSTARRDAAPTPTPGLIGDFGGGGMLLAFGVVCAALEAARSGQGQTIDASICDGSALLAALVYGWRSAGLWNAEAGTNNGDGGAHFYDAYECADGRYVSIGAMEPPFYRLLREKCDLADPAFDAQWDQKRWPALKAQVAAAFKRKTRDEWCSLLEGSDVCFAPVLSLDEAPQHPHNKARGTFATVDGITQPAPAPRFSRTATAPCQPVGEPGAETRSVLQECGFTDAEIAGLTQPPAVI